MYPFILLFATAYFAVSYLVRQYSVVYVLGKVYEGEAQVWEKSYGHFFFALLVYQVFIYFFTFFHSFFFFFLHTQIFYLFNLVHNDWSSFIKWFFCFYSYHYCSNFDSSCLDFYETKCNFSFPFFFFFF